MSVVVEENHQRSESTPTPSSKSSGSIIRIDTISIDLTAAVEAVEAHREARKCEHFSIRGYVAEMRKKDVSICMPFGSDDNQSKSEDQEPTLPPLQVAKFRWWRCQNCLREIIATSAGDIETVPDHSRIGYIFTGTCSHMQCPSDMATVASDLHQIPGMDNFGGRKTAAYTSTNVTKDEIHLSSFGYNKEKKHDGGQASGIGNNNGAGDGVNQEKCNLMCDVPESNSSLIQKRHADGLDALGPKSSGFREFCRQSSKIHAASAKSSGKVYEMGKPISTYSEQNIASMACETPKLVGRTSEGICFVNEPSNKFPSLDLEENEIRASQNEILAEKAHHDRDMDNPNSLIRQKTPKVRLLTELLGSKGNSENGRARTEGGPSRVMPNMPARLDTVSSTRCQIAVQESPKKHFGPKGKRKMSQDEELKSMELICPSKFTKKGRVFKDGSEITHKSIVLANCESAEGPSARVQFARHKIDRNPMPGQKKNKQTLLEDGYYPPVPQGGCIPKTNQVKIGVGEKFSAAADVGFPKSTHDGFINHFRSSLSPQLAERKTNLCKKKSKQVGLGQAGLMLQRTGVLRVGSVVRKNLHISETERKRIKLPAAHDATSSQVLDISLNSYEISRRNERVGVAHTVDGSDPLLSQLKGTPREDHHQGKDILYVGESSGSHKSAPDTFVRKGLLCDLNKKIAVDRTSPLREMQNLVPRIESRSFACPQQSDFSRARNSENTVEVQEQGNDDIPMEIVELMARNQFERFRHEAERNSFLSEQTNDKRDAQFMGFPQVRGNGILKPMSSKGRVTTGQNSGLIKQNPTNPFSGNPFTMGQREGNSSSLPGFSAFSRCKEMQSAGVQITDPQNCKWKADKIERRFSPTKIPVLEVHNTCQNKPRGVEEAEHVRSSVMPNHMAFGFNIPQKHFPQSSNFEMHSQFPNTRDLDLNFMKLHANDLGKQNMNLDPESFRRASAEHPFLHKHREIDLNAKVSGPLDLQSNDTIPAMQLLSLMDAGVKSNSAFNLDGKSKFFTKPFFPCDHHPKVSLNGTSKMLEKPLFPYDGSKCPAAPYGKNHPLEKSYECSTAAPSVPAVGAFASPFQCEGSLKSRLGFMGRVSLKSEERGKVPMQNRGGKSQKSASTNGISRRGREPKPIQDKKKGIIGASNAMQVNGNLDLEANCVNGTVFPMRRVSKNEVCSLNRNPADFSIPEAGNPYMISGKDLKFGKKVSARGRPRLNNVDGRKQQRATKHTTMERH